MYFLYSVAILCTLVICVANHHIAADTILDGCIVWNAHNTVLGEEALLIYIVPVGYAT